MPIIRERVRPDSIVYTDNLTAYDTLDVFEFRHRRVNHGKTFVSTRGHHINGIENIWNQAKRHMRRFNWIRKENSFWYLKECEWHFNGGTPKAAKAAETVVQIIQTLALSYVSPKIYLEIETCYSEERPVFPSSPMHPYFPSNSVIDLDVRLPYRHRTAVKINLEL